MKNLSLVWPLWAEMIFCSMIKVSPHHLNNQLKRGQLPRSDCAIAHRRSWFQSRFFRPKWRLCAESSTTEPETASVAATREPPWWCAVRLCLCCALDSQCLYGSELQLFLHQKLWANKLKSTITNIIHWMDSIMFLQKRSFLLFAKPGHTVRQTIQRNVTVDWETVR